MAGETRISLRFCGRTDVGLVRNRNEDDYRIEETADCAVVCDGMGGHVGGAVASRLTAEIVCRCLRDAGGVRAGDRPAAEGLVRSAVAEANEMLLQESRERRVPLMARMGTTLVGFWRPFADAAVALFHVGDSRIYRLRGGVLSALTRDHSAHEEWLRTGRVGIEPPMNLITRAIGLAERVGVDIRWEESVPGDLYLLCSDGLTGPLGDAAIRDRLEALGDRPLDSLAEELIAAANRAGGPDNITVVLVQADAGV